MANTAIRNEEQAVDYLKEIGYFDHLEIVDNQVVTDGSCPRCGGSGWIHAYGHVEGGICFSCHGARTRGIKNFIPIKKYAQKEKARRNAAEKRHAKFQERKAKRQEKLLEGQRNWCEKNGYGRITFEEKEAKEQAEREATKEISQHFGNVKDRVKITAKILAVPGFESRYCYSTVYTRIYIMVTEEGNKVIWKTTTRFDEARKGDTVTFVGTIKEHGERDGEKQTVVTRCKEIVS